MMATSGRIYDIDELERSAQVIRDIGMESFATLPCEKTSRVLKRALKGLVDYSKSVPFGSSSSFISDGSGSNSRSRRKFGATNSLRTLYVEGFDEDQIWEQLQLDNKPLLKRLKKKTKLVHKQMNDIILCVPEKPKKAALRGGSDEEDGEISRSTAPIHADSITGKKTRDMSNSSSLKTSATLADDDDDNNDKGGFSSENDATPFGPTEAPPKALKRRKRVKKDPHGINDGFFSLASMENFAAQEESLNKTRGDDDEGEDHQSWRDALYGGGDAEEEEEEEEDGDMYADSARNSDTKATTYAEFFEEPEDVVSDDDKSDSEEDEDDDESDSDDDDDDKDDESVNDDDDDDDKGDGEVETKQLSAFALRQMAMQQKIAALESEATKARPWALNGEATKKKRPENSLLEVVMDYDRVDKLAPQITIETTESLEDRIKQRILDEAWDDVVRQAPPEAKKAEDELEDVSQEKSREGLGELYEHEYMSKKYGLSGNEEERKKREEQASEMFRALCAKLDSLSNFHFTPTPPKRDVEIKVLNTPAISMEEVLPTAVAAATMRAPEELLNTANNADRKKRPLAGKDEISSEQRQSLRRSKKAARRKRRRQKMAEEKMVARVRPGLGNPYAERRMLEKMRSTGQLVEGKETRGPSSAKLTKSSQFFRELQETVKSEARAIANGLDGDTGKRGSAGSGSRRYKL